jgi:hypothetical protein
MKLLATCRLRFPTTVKLYAMDFVRTVPSRAVGTVVGKTNDFLLVTFFWIENGEEQCAKRAIVHEAELEALCKSPE